MTAFPDLPCPVQITPKALAQIQRIMQQKAIADGSYSLRIGMKGGGCAGASFLLGFDHQKATDEVYRAAEIKVLIEKKHLMYVIGLELDYEDTETESGFVFHNPTR